MRLTSLTLNVFSALLAAHLVHAVPTKRLFENIDRLNDVLLFDGPAFQRPSDPSMVASFQAFVFLRDASLGPGPIVDGFTSFLKDAGVDIADKAKDLRERVKLFGAVGLPGKEVNVELDGCSGKVLVKETSGLPDLGMMLQTLDIGHACAGGIGLQGKKTVTAKVDLGNDDRDFQSTIFPSGQDGYVVLSDVDDTIKVSNVLDKLKLLKATFVDQPEPVPGMPDLYKSLDASLNSPSFFYVTGSPFQLYPFLRSFIQSNYPAGPIQLKNLTFVDIPSAIDFLKADGTLQYKQEQIRRIHSFYPKKQFLLIGDSTEEDPETYAGSFRELGGDVINCIWIRKVKDANNTQERFDETFKGINKFRLFSDPKELENVNVARGEC